MGKAYSAAELSYFIAQCKLGASLAACYDAAGVSKTGITDLRARDPKFEKRFLKARARPRMKVENTLYLAATTADDKGRFNEKAMELWLTNMYGQDWKRKADVTVHEDHWAQISEEIETNKDLEDEQRMSLRKVARDIIMKRHGPQAGDPIN